jgi:hypothetical protein
MRRAKIYFFILVILIFFAGSSFNHYMNDIRLDSLKVELWPEYDREDMLVIYRFSLASDVSLPANVEIHIPARAEDAYQVAMQDLDGLLYRLDYSIKTEGDWMQVSFTTPSPDIQMEFYDPALQRNEDHRSYEFVWYGDYQVDQCSVHIKEPLNATDLTTIPNTEPALGGIGDQLTYEVRLGLIEKNNPFSLQLHYDKADDTLRSSQEESVKSISPITDQIKGRTSFDEVYPWIFAMLGIVLIFASILLFINGRNYPRRQTESGDDLPQTDYSDVEPKAVYCHRCGKRAIKGDYYCRICGEKLRTEY